MLPFLTTSFDYIPTKRECKPLQICFFLEVFFLIRYLLPCHIHMIVFSHNQFGYWYNLVSLILQIRQHLIQCLCRMQRSVVAKNNGATIQRFMIAHIVNNGSSIIILPIQRITVRYKSKDFVLRFIYSKYFDVFSDKKENWDYSPVSSSSMLFIAYSQHLTTS